MNGTDGTDRTHRTDGHPPRARLTLVWHQDLLPNYFPPNWMSPAMSKNIPKAIFGFLDSLASTASESGTGTEVVNWKAEV